MGDEVGDCAADGGCDGLLVDERDCGASLEEAFFFVFGSGFGGGGGDGYGGGGGLDHAEGGDDFVEHVGYLVDGLAGWSERWCAVLLQCSYCEVRHRGVRLTRLIPTMPTMKVT